MKNALAISCPICKALPSENCRQEAGFEDEKTDDHCPFAIEPLDGIQPSKEDFNKDVLETGLVY
ncbi:MAG: hypothetical protein ACRYGG_23755 [Janthinobacterium lividum]